MAVLKFFQDNIILALLNGVETQQLKSCTEQSQNDFRMSFLALLA